MYSLFNSTTSFQPALNKVTGWNVTRKAVFDEMNKLARHYRMTAAWSRNDNVLNQILTTIDVAPNKDKNYVAQNAREDFAPHAGTFGLYSSHVTSRNPPVSNFYNGSCLELLVYDDSWFDANLARANWQNLEPVRILDHPFDDIHLSLPDNNTYKNVSGNSGIAVISINVAMLIVQFHYYIEQMEEVKGTLEQAIGQFILRYPIFNAIKSNLDISIRNRLFKLYNNQDVSNFLKLHPTTIRDFSQLMDNSLRDCARTLKSKNMRYEDLLMQIPAASWNNQLEVMKLPDIAPTRSVKWVLDITRLRTIRNLLKYEQGLRSGSVEEISLSAQGPRNMDTRAFIKRRLMIWKNDRPINIPLDFETTVLLEEAFSLL